MPKITLENGTIVEISKESYKALQDAIPKTWRDAVIEKCSGFVKNSNGSSLTAPRPVFNRIEKTQWPDKIIIALINNGFVFNLETRYIFTNRGHTYEEVTELLKNFDKK